MVFHLQEAIREVGGSGLCTYMDAEPPLDYLLDTTGGPTPGREELQQILARSHSRRNRLAAAGMLATLAVGATGGWLARSGRSSGGTALAAGSGGSSTTAAPLAAAVASAAGYGAVAGGGGYTLTKLFVRTTTDGVTIRAYQPPAPPVATTVPSCPIPPPAFPGLITEISTADVAGQAPLYTQASTTPFKMYGISVVGAAEGAPVWVATVEVESSVAQVRVTFADGKTDQMVPVKGWAALAHVAPPAMVDPKPPTGSVQALDGAGKVIATETFSSLTTLQPPIGVPVPANGVGAAGGGVSVSGGAAVATAPAVPILVPTTVASSPGAAAVATTSPLRPCQLIVPSLPAVPATTTTTKGTG
jgi:hypothetical protein